MITIKRWHAFILLALSGFAVGNLLAKLASAMGV
jgi:hypothetical protein